MRRAKKSNRIVRNIMCSIAIVGAMAFGAGVGTGIVMNAPTAQAEEANGFVAMRTVPMDINLQKHVYDVANEYGLDWTLLMAVIQKESRFDPYVVSATSDYGLMQINHINHGWLSVETGVNDFLDPYQNVRAGAYMLKQLFDKYQDPHMALMAYNVGEGGASWCWEQGVYTSQYSREVINIQRELKRANRGMMA